MSREERRNYQRQMRTVDRGPALPPAAKARAERNAARRAARSSGAPTYTFTRRYLVMAVLLALAAGYLAFSFLWPNMPLAAIVGTAAAAIAFALALVFRLAQRRAAGH
jgi:hypothetical protein